MQTLNLAHFDKSDIKYEIFKYPDGEVNIQILSEIPHKEPINVLTRITSADELYILCQVNDILTRHEVEWNLYISYLMSMRMDRVMSFNRPFSLKVVAGIINTFSYSEGFILEPHSHQTIKLLDRFYSDSGYSMFVDSLARLHKVYENVGDVCVVLPDIGSYNRYPMFYNKVVFNKERDLETGKILKFTLDGEPCKEVDEFVFIDDLCDAGGTFIGELKVLKEKFPDKKYSIIVTHAVNVNGIINLIQNFDNIYITNSYADWTQVKHIDNLHILEVI